MKVWFFLIPMFIVFMALFPLDFGGYAQAMNRTLDMGHFFAFGVLAYMVLRWGELRRLRSPYWAASFICSILIVSIEFVQPLFGRTASLFDVWNSFAGVLVTLMGMYIRSAIRKPRLIYGHYLLALVLLAVAAYPAVNAWYAQWWRLTSFPVLARFENSVELELWRGWNSEAHTQGHELVNVSLSREYAVEGVQSLKVATIPGTWSGMRYYAGKSSWRGYSSISFYIYNPGDAFKLLFRIDDSRPTPNHSERFNRFLVIAPGENYFEISIDDVEHSTAQGVLDIDSISKILLVTRPGDSRRTFFLDEVQLIQ